MRCGGSCWEASPPTLASDDFWVDFGEPVAVVSVLERSTGISDATCGGGSVRTGATDSGACVGSVGTLTRVSLAIGIDCLGGTVCVDCPHIVPPAKKRAAAIISTAAKRNGC